MMPGYYSGPGNVLCACPASTQRRINHRHLPFLLYRTKRKSRADLCYSVAQWRRGRRRRNAHLRSARPRSPFLSDRVRFTVESGGGGKTVRDASPLLSPLFLCCPEPNCAGSTTNGSICSEARSSLSNAESSSGRKKGVHLVQ